MAPIASQRSLGWYVERIKSTPLLTADEERRLARRIREHSDPIAREMMIRANLRLVVNIAKAYSNPGMTLNDLVAEGNLGLMRAVEEFDPDAGVRFSTYAAWWIKQAIKRAMINAGQPIHIPAYLVKLITKWRRVARQFEASFGRPPSSEEMAAKLKISAKKAEIIRQGLVAVAAPGRIGPDESQTNCQVVEDTSALPPEQDLMDAANGPTVRRLLERLEPRQRQILELRFGLDLSGRASASPAEPRAGGAWRTGTLRTYKEIGKIVGLTRERVRQLEKKALAQLRDLADQIL